MPFAAGTQITNRGRAMTADRVRTTPATYANPPKWIGMGTGATAAARTAAVTDTALSAEVETRAVGSESTVTVNVTGDTYQVTGTQTATATRAIDEAGLFDQLAAGGNMFLSATLGVISLSNGDSIAWTVKATYA